MSSRRRGGRAGAAGGAGEQGVDLAGDVAHEHAEGIVVGEGSPVGYWTSRTWAMVTARLAAR